MNFVKQQVNLSEADDAERIQESHMTGRRPAADTDLAVVAL